MGNNGEVIITGNIDPTLTFDLSSTTCDLGTLNSAQVNTCLYNATVSTNGANGYASFINADGAFRNSAHSFLFADFGGTVDQGVEKYGISTTSDYGGSSGQMTDVNSDSFINGDDCDYLNGGTTSAPAGLLDTAGVDVTYSGNIGPVANEVTYLCHATSIEDTTPAGSYAQLVTLTTVANF